MIVKLNIFGDQADKIAERFGLVMDNDLATFETNISVTYRSIEGHPKIELEINV